jgi:pilus assembly protein Flp/PilA
MKHTIERLREQEGATAVEYGIMVALIAIVIIAAVFALGGQLRDNFQSVGDCLADQESCPEGEAPDGG